MPGLTKFFPWNPDVEDGFTPIQILVTRDNRLLVQGREKDSSPAVYETTLPARQQGAGRQPFSLKVLILLLKREKGEDT